MPFFRSSSRTVASSNPIDAAVARVVAGDADAVVEIYEAHHASVRAFARRLVGEEAIAEDLVHEVFLSLPKLLGRFRGDCSLQSYLVSIAAKLAKQHVRTASRKRAMLVRLSGEPFALPERPDDLYERRELARLLTLALDRLPHDQRVAFVLCEVEERSSVEVAGMIDESDGTVRARVFHAKKKLREYLAELRFHARNQGKEAAS